MQATGNNVSANIINSICLCVDGVSFWQDLVGATSGNIPGELSIMARHSAARPIPAGDYAAVSKEGEVFLVLDSPLTLPLSAQTAPALSDEEWLKLNNIGCGAGSRAIRTDELCGMVCVVIVPSESFDPLREAHPGSRLISPLQYNGAVYHGLKTSAGTVIVLFRGNGTLYINMYAPGGKLIHCDVHRAAGTTDMAYFIASVIDLYKVRERSIVLSSGFGKEERAALKRDFGKLVCV